MPAQPTLFLDFDGVLHPTSGDNLNYFCAAPVLSAAVSGRDVQLVVSSSWRFDHSLDELRALLPSDLGEKVCGVTGPAHVGRHARYVEITTFVRQHGLREWRALDDSTWEFPPTCRELISCNPNTGLTFTQGAVLSEWLDSLAPRTT